MMQRRMVWFAFLIVFHGVCVAAYFINPSDYFSAAQHRPKLEIVHPNNGEIMDNGDLEIKIKVDGYDMPSSFYNSTICVGLSSGLTFAEQCFEQTMEHVFHANGLIPGNQYTLRVVLIERGNTIAVSVRHFRVAGIYGLLNKDEVVTIQTAVQVAMEYQMLGMEAQAEAIYRSILSENPAYPDALHLLGVIFYQKGDVLSAIPYIEKALQSNKTFEGFHNSLGVCYRTLGRMEEAELQFKLAVALNPSYMSAIFNLGLTIQQLNRWDEAIVLYHQVNEFARLQPDLVKPQVRLESKIRECDLIQGQQRTIDALLCWEDGIELFPMDGVIRNEIGTMYAKANLLEQAAAHFEVSIAQGYFLAHLNLARVREIQGYDEEAKTLYQQALEFATMNTLPSFHIRICLASVHPRLLSSADETIAWRSSLKVSLLQLLDLAPSNEVDNTPPMSFGFSTGYHLTFHGAVNNVDLKTQLYKVYSLMCPSLLQGYYVEKQLSVSSDDNHILLSHESTSLTNEIAPDRKKTNDLAAPSAFISSGTSPQSTTQDLIVVVDSVLHSSFINSTFDNVTTTLRNVDSKKELLNIENISRSSPYSQRRSSRSASKVRIGFISKYMHSHPVGRLVEGLMALMVGPDGRDDFEVVVFFLGGGEDTKYYDQVQKRIAKLADVVYSLPPEDIAVSAATVRSADLDVLIFPEIGLDLATYYLAFARLAPVQAAWLGHPDTTGVTSVDYFLSSSVEMPSAAKHYSEQLYRFTGFGTQFTDDYSQHAKLLETAPRTILLNRAKFTEDMHIPKSAHIYLLTISLCKIHHTFDDVIRLILTKDKLSYIVIVNEQEPQVHWKNLFFARMSYIINTANVAETLSRIIFYSPLHSAELVNIMQIAHVYLDAFPVTEDFQLLLQALAVGLPVVTMPSNVMGGRFALALYSMMDYGLPADQSPFYSELPEDATESSSNFLKPANLGDFHRNTKENDSVLVVSTIHDYVTMAMKLTHQPKLREQHSSNILRRRSALFERNGTQVLEEWRVFVREALHNCSRGTTSS